MKKSVILAIFCITIYFNLTLFDQTGGDLQTHISAVESFLQGTNPYTETIASYKNLKNDPSNKGFAYLPGFLYTNGFLYTVHLYLQQLFPCNVLTLSGYCKPFSYIWKIPTLLAKIGIGVLLVKVLGKKHYLATVFALIALYFNPFFVFKRDFTPLDPQPIFFMFLSLYYLKKDDVLSGASYAFSVALKNFPLFILPVMLLKSKNKLQFILAASFVGIALSIPFMSSKTEFLTYLNGALFVHSDRFLQGRPFLFYISYFYNVEFFQIVSLKTYTFLATFSGWFLIGVIYLFRDLKVRGEKIFSKLTNKYVLATIPFLTFYLFTPVLNRTYLLWFLPTFIVACYKLFSKKLKISMLYYGTIISYWVFYYWYLAQWKDGFHIWHP